MEIHLKIKRSKRELEALENQEKEVMPPQVFCWCILYIFLFIFLLIMFSLLTESAVGEEGAQRGSAGAWKSCLVRMFGRNSW